MKDANAAIDHVLKIEGGYVNHPDDPGGATNYGITQKTFDTWCRSNKSQPYHVKWITKEIAREIYKAWYWDAIRGDDYPQWEIALIVFDQAVNQGVRRVSERLQRALNLVGRTTLVLDGKIGPKTLRALHDAPKKSLKLCFIHMSELYYLSLNKPMFMKGWLRRTQQLDYFI